MSQYSFVVSGDGYRKDASLTLKCFRLPNGKFRRQPQYAYIYEVNRVGIKDGVYDVASSDVWPDRQRSTAKWHSYYWDSSTDCTRKVEVTNRQWWGIGFKSDTRLPHTVN